MPKEIKILNVRLNIVKKDELLEDIFKRTKEGLKTFIATVNPEFLVEANKNKEFRDILNCTEINVVDGVGIIKLAKILYGIDIGKRVAGVDLVYDISKRAGEDGIKIFLLGAGKGVAKECAKKLQEKFERLIVTGADEEAEIEKINNSGAEILFVALGAPKQEIWIYKNFEKLKNIKIVMGVGGAFDIISGKKPRASEFFIKANLEWLHRLIIEPKRIKRILKATIVFPYLATREKILSLFR